MDTQSAIRLTVRDETYISKSFLHQKRPEEIIQSTGQLSQNFRLLIGHIPP
jgi:hypothetical protein